ncbi:MAG: histidine kinase, partial [Oscillospiraceae bacterium]|nr:histidine kinase [Oscillospiraceae bacterium]
ACSMFRLKGPEEIIGQPIVNILNPTDYLSAITVGQSVKECKHYLAEYDKYVAETIIYDKEYRMLYSFMRDITAHEQQAAERAEMRSKTVEITNAVIEKQMRVVQEIASLLGETTAETKIALTQLKNTLEK